MSQVELACKEAVFHFNKKHNEDSSLPPWVVKHKGNTYYVNHITSTVGFSTKETPGNEHTKGSILFRGKLKIDKDEDSGNIFAEVW